MTIRTLGGQVIHEKITLRRINSQLREHLCGVKHPGMCIRCGRTQQGVELDAERYMCPRCKSPTVYGPMMHGTAET